MNNRERMRASNVLVRYWLLENNYDEIWFKPHGKRNDYVFTQGDISINPDNRIYGSYLAQDIWNLFDGICLGNGKIVFLAMKTNSWANGKNFEIFVRKYDCQILSFNVSNQLKESKGKYTVFVRRYSS